MKPDVVISRYSAYTFEGMSQKRHEEIVRHFRTSGSAGRLDSARFWARHLINLHFLRTELARAIEAARS